MPGTQSPPTVTASPTPPTAPPLPLDFRRRRLRATIGAFLLMIGTSGATGMSFINLSGSTDFDVPLSTFLIYFSFFTVASGLSMGASGKLAARFGIKAVIVASGTLTSVAMLGMALSPTLNVVFLFAALAGFGWGGCTMMAAAVVINGWHTHSKRGTVLGLVMAGTGPGGMAWGFIMPPLIAATSWRGAMVGIAVACAILMIANGLILISNPPAPAKHDQPVEHGQPVEQGLPRTTRIKTAGRLAPLALLIVATFILALESPLYAVLPHIFATAGIGPTEAGVLVSIFSFCLILTPPLLGFINDKAGIHVMLAVNALAYAVALPALALLTGFVPTAVAVVVLSMAIISPTVVIPLVVTRTVGEERFPAVYGIVMMILYFGLATGAPLWGLSYDLTGEYAPALYIAVLGAVLALTLMAVAIRTSKEKAHGGPGNEVLDAS